MRPPALGATAIALMRAWACGLRTKATSCVWGSCTSETNCPRPRKWRASSLRRSDAPTAEVVFATARVMRLSFGPLHRRMRPDRKYSKPATVSCQQAASGLGFGLGFWTWLLDLALDLARKRCQVRDHAVALSTPRFSPWAALSFAVTARRSILPAPLSGSAATMSTKRGCE